MVQNWIKVISQEELVAGERRVVTVEGHTVLLIHEGDHIYAILNACPHMRLPLKGGKITEDGAIVCPFHRSAFDLDTGDVKAWSPWPPVVGKMLGTVSKEKALRVFPTKVEAGYIWIGLS
ncbi:MAG: Rieske (2Fe-2S) protein [Anaerolineae bacterium]|nr:Rieske (2Fe-2S) protein [Anaerolineae bacterium]